MKTETRIYVGTYAKYNDGNLAGKWLTMQDYSDADELFEAMKELHDDEDGPEFMIQDSEGFLSDKIDESLSIADMAALYNVFDAVENSHLDPEVIEAYADNMGSDIDEDTVSDCEDCYCGQYNSDADFAEDLADQLGYLDKNVSWPYNCIDWEWAARELMYDHFESNGHYFISR
jgi:antirestriction protein